MLKFRTVRIEPNAGENGAAWAARALAEESDANREPPSENDRRTPIGRFLRRWSLNELPQVLNIVRGDTPLDDRVECDNYYLENWSPWLDLKILLLTPGAVLGGRGAE